MNIDTNSGINVIYVYLLLKEKQQPVPWKTMKDKITIYFLFY
jgi:hypothetical protein